jgi:hypothetical protein
MSPNARTVLVAVVTAAVFFALGRMTLDTGVPERAATGDTPSAARVDEPTDVQLAASAPREQIATRSVVEAQPIEAVTEAPAQAPALEESRAAEQARVEAFLQAQRSPSATPDLRAESSEQPWSEAKLAIRSKFELTHKTAAWISDVANDLRGTYMDDDRSFERQLDARERSVSRIAEQVGKFVGVVPLPEAKVAQAVARLAILRERLEPVVDEAIDLYEQALLDAWTYDQFLIWREGEAEPEPLERTLPFLGPSTPFGGRVMGWRYAFEIGSSDHPALDAAFAEIEALKVACIEDLAALAQD